MMERFNLRKLGIQISPCFDKTVILLERKLLKNLIYLIIGFTVVIFQQQNWCLHRFGSFPLNAKLVFSELIGQSKENKIIA